MITKMTVLRTSTSKSQHRTSTLYIALPQTCLWRSNMFITFQTHPSTTITRYLIIADLSLSRGSIMTGNTTTRGSIVV